jgi:hypothetical protein
LRIFRPYTQIILLSLFFMALLGGSSCRQQETATRLDQITSLDRLEGLASSGRMRIEDPGNGFSSVVVASRRNALTSDDDAVFDVVVKGELSKSRQTLIQNNYMDELTLLLIRGSRFRIKRAPGASAPQVIVSMSGKGAVSGVRSELVPIVKPPYSIARILISAAGALPDFNPAAGGRGIYIQADFRADLGAGGNADAADYRIPLQRLLKLLFEIEHPPGSSGSISGSVFLLHYKVKQAQAQSVLFDCLYYVTID